MKNNMELSPVSIIMANYNHGHYIDEALSALLAQSYKPDEIIIIDDASTDNSKERIRDWESKCPELIKFYENEKNQGVLPTIQRGVELAENELVLFHSADDLLLTDCLEKFAGMLAEYPQAAFCCSNPAYFEKDPSARVQLGVDWSDQPAYLKSEEVAKKLNGGWIPGYALVKKSLLAESGGIIESFKWNADWFWLLVMAFRHGLCYVPETLALNRQEENSFLNAGMKDKQAMDQFYTDLLHRLTQKEYDDVFPRFASSAALGAFGAPLAQFYLEHSRQFDSKALLLLQSNFQAWNHQLALKQNNHQANNQAINSGADEDFFPMESMASHLISHCKDHGYTRVAVFGEALCAQKLLQYWNRFNGPQVLHTLTQETIKTFQADQVDAIVIASKSNELEYVDDCRQRFSATPVLALWNPYYCSVPAPVVYGLEKIIPLIIFNLESQEPVEGLCLYGAGSHTQALVDIWRKNNGPSISQILTTDTPDKPFLKGIPVMSIADIASDSVKTIIISSHTYEDEMSKVALEKFPDSKIIKVWNT